MTIEELKILITAETSGLKSQLNQAQSQLSSFSSKANKSASGISQAFSKAFKAISVTAMVAGLTKLGKEAVSVASDLQEVQNVVDVAFGSAASEINEFASTAITQLGMSELKAKQFASTFMAMGNGMGVATSEGKTMAVELTKLAGDMASFYNVEQDVAETALKSVYTGETETLKKFGVVMTEANLEAYALSQGISKQYKNMTQAEKVALRYSYVMSSTANAQGDFARTSDSWANQTRILSEQWKQLLGVLGNGLIQVLKPIVQCLNEMLASAIQVANSLSKAFGWTGIESTSASVESTAAGLEETVAATDAETESAKKLEKQLGSFDELNILKDKDSTSGTAGAVDVSSVTSKAEGEVEASEENNTNKFKAYLQDLKGIFEKWFSDIPSLEFNFDSSKAMSDLSQIGTDITNVIAGWGSFIITIGINVLNDLDLGQLSNDVLTLTASFTELCSVLTDVLVPAFENLYNVALKPIVEWIGDKLHDAFSRATVIVSDFAAFIEEHTEGIQAWIDIIAELAAVVWQALEPILNAEWEYMCASIESVYEIVKTLLGVFFDLGEVIKLAFTDPQAALDLLMQKIEKWKEDFSGLAEKLKTIWANAFEAIFSHATEVWGNLWETIKTGATNFLTFLGLLGAKMVRPFTDAWAKIRLGATNALTAVKTTFNTIPEWFKTVFTKAWTNVKNVFSTGGKIFDGIKEGILDGLKTVVNAIIKGMNKVISVPFKGLNKALQKIRDVEILGTHPFSFIDTIDIPEIPSLAKGGVLNYPQLIVAGDAGAGNPEIVTPENKMREIFNEGNSSLADVYIQIGRQIIQAIENQNLQVSIGDDVIARSAARGNQSYYRMTGRALIT